MTGIILSTDAESDLSPFWRTKNSRIVGELCKELCRAEREEVSKHHYVQTRIQCSGGFAAEAEAEVEELSDVKEGLRNQ